MKKSSQLWSQLRSFCPSLWPGWPFLGYLAVFAGAVLMTQLLRSPASALFFWFICLFPLFSLLYLLVARVALMAIVDTDRDQCAKGEALEYTLKLINESPLPFPYVEAVLSLPEERGVRCTLQCCAVSLPPLGNHAIRERVSFPYRGSYPIGVDALIVRDFLGLFRLYIPMELYRNVEVLPRRLRMEREGLTAATDVPSDSVRVVQGADRSEIGDIRGYQNGDPLKDIHWKLSSKTQNLQVKQYHANAARSVYVFCDLARGEEETVAPAPLPARKLTRREKRKRRRACFQERREALRAWAEKQRLAWDENKTRRRRLRGMSRGRAEDMAALDDLIRVSAVSGVSSTEEAVAAENTPAPETPSEKRAISDSPIREEYAADMDEIRADGVVELTLAAVESELSRGNSCTLLWFDPRQSGGIGHAVLTAEEDLEAVFARFATAPACDAEYHVSRLSLLVEEAVNVTVRIVTPHIDLRALSRYSGVPAMFGGAGSGCVTEILLYNPEECYCDREARREYVEMCREQLSREGILLYDRVEIGERVPR